MMNVTTANPAAEAQNDDSPAAETNIFSGQQSDARRVNNEPRERKP